jgi:5-(carboxyamino)imidazole ribonucleotide synthase
MQRDLNTEEVGILGGGQLARMLAQSALTLGLKPVIFSEDPRCPAADAASAVVSDLTALLARVSVVAFENEFVDCSLLQSACLAAKRDAAKLFKPELATIQTLQDKLAQKNLLERLKIPTAPFVELKSLADLEKLKTPMVLKWSKLGYDGKGVMIFDPKRRASAVPFCQAALSRGIPVYAEEKINFKRELAVIGVASPSQFVTYPLVISEQENGVCKRVTGPATALGVAKKLEVQAARIARKISHDTGLLGAFGVEFFEDRQGRILVNEIAPRVHNSGHYTQNAFAASQFENHWRALLNLPLYVPRSPKNRRFAMLNLLGPEKASLSGSALPLPIPTASTHLHWYGKLAIRPRRKLGHLNGVAETPREFKNLLEQLKLCERNWLRRTTR